MFKSGFVTIIGKANVGKSTLLNALVDTPGIHKAKNELSKFMMKNVESALDGVDIVIYVLNGEKSIDENDMKIINQYAASSTPFIVVINKMDVADREKVLGMIDKLKDIEGIDSIVPISAMKGKKLDILKERIEANLKEGVQFYPEDMITDKSVRFMVAEIIREKAMKFLGEEVPYGVAVSINLFKERDDSLIDIDADIICEKSAHKPIIIGKGGAMLKKIGSSARVDIEKLLDCKVFLNLWVRVKADWRDSELMLNELGYNIKDI